MVLGVVQNKGFRVPSYIMYVMCSRIIAIYIRLDFHRYFEGFFPMLKIPTCDSSVGRVKDCSSLGRWFEANRRKI